MNSKAYYFERDEDGNKTKKILVVDIGSKISHGAIIIPNSYIPPVAYIGKYGFKASIPPIDRIHCINQNGFYVEEGITVTDGTTVAPSPTGSDQLPRGLKKVMEAAKDNAKLSTEMHEAFKKWIIGQMP